VSTVEFRSTVLVEGDEYEATFATILKANIEKDIDHGIYTGWVYLALQTGGTQGFGGLDLGKIGDLDPNYDLLGVWVKCVMTVVGVDSWDDLKGKNVIVLKLDDSGPINGLMNINDHTNIWTPFWKEARHNQGAEG
jgi:hypothetical protein